MGEQKISVQVETHGEQPQARMVSNRMVSNRKHASKNASLTIAFKRTIGLQKQELTSKA